MNVGIAGNNGTMGSPVVIGFVVVGSLHYMLDGSGRYIYHEMCSFQNPCIIRIYWLVYRDSSIAAVEPQYFG